MAINESHCSTYTQTLRMLSAITKVFHKSAYFSLLLLWYLIAIKLFFFIIIIISFVNELRKAKPTIGIYVYFFY